MLQTTTYVVGEGDRQQLLQSPAKAQIKRNVIIHVQIKAGKSLLPPLYKSQLDLFRTASIFSGAKEEVFFNWIFHRAFFGCVCDTVGSSRFHQSICLPRANKFIFMSTKPRFWVRASIKQLKSFPLSPGRVAIWRGEGKRFVSLLIASADVTAAVIIAVAHNYLYPIRPFCAARLDNPLTYRHVFRMNVFPNTDRHSQMHEMAKTWHMT